MRILAIALWLASSICATAQDHTYWRKLAIISQAQQAALSNAPVFVVAGRSQAAEALFLGSVCGVQALNASIYQGSEKDVGDALVDAASVTTARVVIAIDLPSIEGAIHIPDAELGVLSKSVTDAVRKSIGC